MISELVGQKGVYPFLNRVFDQGTSLRTTAITDLLVEEDVPSGIFDDLLATGLFRRSPNDLYLSPKGERIILLLRILNGDATLPDLLTKLRDHYPNLANYELVTSNITDFFIDSVLADSTFIRLLICSPWINLDAGHLAKLETALSTASRLYNQLDVKVVTQPQTSTNNVAAGSTFDVIERFGGQVFFHDHKNSKSRYLLHTKLYILEPGPNGGAHFALVGSENFTGQGNVELAIKVENDNGILRRLNDYFSDLVLESTVK